MFYWMSAMSQIYYTNKVNYVCVCVCVCVHTNTHTNTNVIHLVSIIYLTHCTHPIKCVFVCVCVGGGGGVGRTYKHVSPLMNSQIFI